MECARCGEPLIYGDRRCWHCGAPAGDERPALRRTVVGLPVLPADPSSFRPPVGREGWGTSRSADRGWTLPRAAQIWSQVSPSLPLPLGPGRRGYRTGMVAALTLGLCL